MNKCEPMLISNRFGDLFKLLLNRFIVKEMIDFIVVHAPPNTTLEIQIRRIMLHVLKGVNNPYNWSPCPFISGFEIEIQVQFNWTYLKSQGLLQKNNKLFTTYYVKLSIQMNIYLYMCVCVYNTKNVCNINHIVIWI